MSIELLVIFLYFPSNVHGIRRDVPSFISDSIILCFFSSHFLVYLAGSLSILFISPKEPSFLFHRLFYWFVLNFIDFCYNFYFLVYLDLICSYYHNFPFKILIIYSKVKTYSIDFRYFFFPNVCIQSYKFTSKHCSWWIPQILINCIFIFI